MIIAVDPHKSLHIAAAVDSAANESMAKLRLVSSLAGCRHRLWTRPQIAVWFDKFREGRLYGHTKALHQPLPVGTTIVVSNGAVTLQRP